MSLRPRALDAPVASRTHLQHVLQAGLDVSVATVSGMPAIVIDGVHVSTDPNNWTGLTVNQMLKLRLNPRDNAEFNRKGMLNRNNPNSAYDGTEFFSTVAGLYQNFRFWVVHLGARRDHDRDVSYYVIARPPNDTSVYRPAMGIA